MEYSNAIAYARQKKNKQGGRWFVIKMRGEYLPVHERYLENNRIKGNWFKRTFFPEYKIIKELK